jgi:hypothetical protein
MRRHLLLALLSVGLLFAASCGDDDATETTDESEDTTAEEEASDDEGSEDEGSDDIDSAAGAIDFMGSDCYETAMEFSSFYASLGGAFAGTGDTDEYEELLDGYASSAPDELKDDFEVIRDEYVPFFEAIAEIDQSNPDAGDMQKLAEASEDVDSEAVEEATANITAYFEEHCPQG